MLLVSFQFGIKSPKKKKKKSPCKTSTQTTPVKKTPKEKPQQFSLISDDENSATVISSEENDIDVSKQRTYAGETKSKSQVKKTEDKNSEMLDKVIVID